MKYLLSSALAVAMIAGPAVAQTASVKTTDHHGVVKTTEMLKNGKNVEKITCKSFNALDESFKPQAVGYAVDYTAKGKPKDPRVDVAGTETVTPLVITDCKAHPDQTLVQRIKAAFRR